MADIIFHLKPLTLSLHPSFLGKSLNLLPIRIILLEREDEICKEFAVKYMNDLQGINIES